MDSNTGEKRACPDCPGVCEMADLPTWLRPFNCRHVSDTDRRARTIAFRESGEAADRFDGATQQFDPEHADLGWTIAEPLPYYPQRKPTLAVRLLTVTMFRRYRCQANRWCSWAATEVGGECDRHSDFGGNG